MGTNLWQPFQLQLDASGNGTAEVGAPALGFNWAAFITMGTAPAGQTFTVSVSGQVVASGGRQSGAFAAGSGQVVTVTVSGGTASSTVNGVVQGSINQGVAPSAPMPSSGSLIEISGGTIDVTGSKITIAGGQGGNVNVSTDAPPVTGPILSIPAGSSSVTDTLHPPANATAIGISLVPIPTYTLQVTIQDALTLVEIADVLFPAAGAGVLGRSLTIPLTPGMTTSGIIVTAQAGGTLVVDTNFAYTLWYLGTNSFQPVNFPTQPTYVQGPNADDWQSGVGGFPPIYSDQVVLGGLAIGQVPSSQPRADVLNSPVAPAYAKGFSASVAAGAGVVVVSGVSGKSIRLRRIYFSTYVTPSGGNAGVWTGGGGSPDYWNFNLFTAGPWGADFEGFALPVGSNLELHCASGTLDLNGAITYDLW